MHGQVTIYALCDPDGAVRYVGMGARVALRRVADRLGVVDLHARAAEVLARKRRDAEEPS